MSTFEIVSLMALGVLAWLWYDSVEVRALGIRAARRACEADGLQLLDDSVSIAGLTLARNDNGRLLLRRAYVFDYSDTGDNRRQGSIVMLGQQVVIVNVNSVPLRVV